MTLKSGGSAYTKGEVAGGGRGVGGGSKPTTAKAIKSRSMKSSSGRSWKKNTDTLRRHSEANTSVHITPAVQQERLEERAVHFRITERLRVAAEDDDIARANPFRRSSKFRQPLKRVSRAEGSPPPVHFARIRPIPKDPLVMGKLTQPIFDSDGESETEEEELPPILLRDVIEPESMSDGESNSTDSSSDEETSTILPETTSDDKQEVEEEQLRIAVQRASVARNVTLLRRRSSYRASVRRGSQRVSSSVRRNSTAARQTSTKTRRCSIATSSSFKRRSSVPGYVVRRRSSVSTTTSPSQLRNKRRRQRRGTRRRPRKIVVIGEMCTGKTSLISAYSRDKFSDVYVPTILTSRMTDADVLGEKIELVVVEVAGRIDYAKMRRCAYHKMDLVVLCYSANNPSSLSAIQDHWLPELLEYAPKVPYILVGTKKDLRDEMVYEVELGKESQLNLVKNKKTPPPPPPSINPTTLNRRNSSLELYERVVTTSQGRKAAETLGAKDFIECSAMYRDGTRKVFESAAKLALRRSPRRKKKHCSSRKTDTCTIL